MKRKDKKKKRKKEDLTMIQLKSISKSFGNQVILKNIDLSVFNYERVALVGANGSGKSTLLKILAGALEPDKGEIEKLSDSKIAYFPQEISSEHLKKTGRDFFVQEIKTRPEKVLGEIGMFCKQLQFPVEKIDEPIESLSGGEKSKIMLMIILKSQADIILLDEPTNNLDLQGLIVLENFILASNQGFFIVSHDRKFLDRLVTKVIELDEQTHDLKIYPNASYRSYLKERKKRENKEIEAYESYQAEKQRLLETARKKKQEALKMAQGPKQRRDKDKYVIGFKKDRAKKIASHALRIEKQISRLQEVKQPRHRLPLNLSFLFSKRSGDLVFQLKNIETTRNQFCLGPLSWEVNYGDRIAIIGPNGQGKTTLLEILAGKQETQKGVLRIGSMVKIGYLSQETFFKQKESILDYFLRITESKKSDAYQTLVRFGFASDEVKANTDNLSAGEKSRLILSTLMAQEINCLLLDEPTNHLDPEALDRLEQALKGFAGTIILVSHDRYLIEQINMTKTYLMEKGKLSVLHDYHQYESKFH